MSRNVNYNVMNDIVLTVGHVNVYDIVIKSIFCFCFYFFVVCGHEPENKRKTNYNLFFVLICFVVGISC